MTSRSALSTESKPRTEQWTAGPDQSSNTDVPVHGTSPKAKAKWWWDKLDGN